MTSSFLSSSETHNSDPTILHGEKNEVLGRQPVIAKEGKDHLALLDMKKMEKPQGTSKDKRDCPVSLAAGEVPCNRPSIPASFPEDPAFLLKEASQVEEQINKDQQSKNPNQVLNREDKTALDVDDRFTLPVAQKPPIEQSNEEGTRTCSLSPSEVSGGGIIEKDSPESPFEVIIDKAAFDREFKDSYKESTNDLGGWAVHTDKELSADMSETNDKVFPLRNREAGRYPSSALLTRQFSHTTAALEEVSRCVNDIHNFTNEILTWDLVPQVKQQTDKSSDYPTKSAGLDRSEYHSEIPVVNLRTNTHQKIPACSINGSTPITKSTGDWEEASLPQENAIIGKSVSDYLISTKEVNVKGGQGDKQKQDDVLPELPGSPCEKHVSLGSGVATVKVVLPDDLLKDETNWQTSALEEITEADSSGESDDTVIEDITAERSFENRIHSEKPFSIPSAVVKTGEREIKEIPSCRKIESTTSKSTEELVRGPHQTKSDSLGRRPVDEAVCSPIAGMNVMLEDVKQSKTVGEGAPEKPITTDNPKLRSALPNVFNETEFSLNVTASTTLESLYGNHIKDIDDSSPEDLMATLTETREKLILGKEEETDSEAVSQKPASPVEVLSESESNSSSKNSAQSKETNGSDFLDVFTTHGTPVVSLDLEQEQLTIRALKELGERQGEEPPSVQGEESLSEERLKQTFAPEPWPQRSDDILEHTDVKTGSDLGISKKPTIIKETRVDIISSLSKTELVNKHVLPRLLTDFSGNHLH